MTAIYTLRRLFLLQKIPWRDRDFFWSCETTVNENKKWLTMRIRDIKRFIDVTIHISSFIVYGSLYLGDCFRFPVAWPRLFVLKDDQQVSFNTIFDKNFETKFFFKETFSKRNPLHIFDNFPCPWVNSMSTHFFPSRTLSSSEADDELWKPKFLQSLATDYKSKASKHSIRWNCRPYSWNNRFYRK